MSNYVAVDPYFGVQGPMSATSTVQLHALGKTVFAEDRQTGNSSVSRGAGQFVYAQGSNVTALGQFVQLSNGSAVLLASANSGSFFPIGLAAGNISATNVFGWVQVGGIADYARGTNSAVAAGIPLYLCATAGLLASVAGAGSRVVGVVAPNSYTSSQSAAFTVQLGPAIFIPGVTAGL